ncbi:MAG: DNA polymerase III subunit delta [Candidatus Saccharibacteria bacterium]
MITTLAGNNRYLLASELEKRTMDFVDLYGEFSLEKVDGEEASYEQLQGSAESHPFLSEKKLVILRSPSANKQFVENFDKWLERVADTSEVIILEPKIDKRLGYFKQLKKHTELVMCDDLNDMQLPSWLVGLAKDKKANLSLSDARYLIERVGSNQMLLQNELEKLILYNQDVTRSSIELLTSHLPQSTVFNLLDAAFGGNTKKALEIYEEQRAQKVEPLMIMGMIAWQLHVVALVKTATDKTPNDIAVEAKINPFVVQKSQAIARRLTLSQLRNIIKTTAELDTRLKTTTMNSDEALCQLLISFSEI